jgi:hypothetical protein
VAAVEAAVVDMAVEVAAATVVAAAAGATSRLVEMPSRRFLQQIQNQAAHGFVYEAAGLSFAFGPAN